MPNILGVDGLLRWQQVVQGGSLITGSVTVSGEASATLLASETLKPTVMIAGAGTLAATGKEGHLPLLSIAGTSTALFALPAGSLIPVPQWLGVDLITRWQPPRLYSVSNIIGITGRSTASFTADNPGLVDASMGIFAVSAVTFVAGGPIVSSLSISGLSNAVFVNSSANVFSTPVWLGVDTTIRWQPPKAIQPFNALIINGRGLIVFNGTTAPAPAFTAAGHAVVVFDGTVSNSGGRTTIAGFAEATFTGHWILAGFITINGTSTVIFVSNSGAVSVVCLVNGNTPGGTATPTAGFLNDPSLAY